jgi:multidrug efflux pump subunit AcrB
VVLENIFRHLEMGEAPEEAAEKGGREVALPVLAATFTTAIVFFPVVFLYGVSRFLFTVLALSVVLSLFASYAVALTVVPLFCARFLRGAHMQDVHHKGGSWFTNFVRWFNRRYDKMLMHYDIAVRKSLLKPGATVSGILGIFLLSLCLFPLMGLSFFPRTDPGQFVINVKAPSGTRLEVTDQYIARTEADIRAVIPAGDLGMIVSNIGITPDFSGNLYRQLRPAHGLCTGKPEEEPQQEQLCLHGHGARQAARRPARTDHLFSDWRPRGCGGEPWPSRSHRHPGGR